jgi:hypothetical protein
MLTFLRLNEYLKKKFKSRRSARNDEIMTAVIKAREARLCMDYYCSTGCNVRFMRFIKDALAVGKDSTSPIVRLDPPEKEKVRYFCKDRARDLSHGEISVLLWLCEMPDPRNPDEAKLIQKRSKELTDAHAEKIAEFEKNVAERRAIKKQLKKNQHESRIEKKRERDHYYWIAYWAAMHAIRDATNKK